MVMVLKPLQELFSYQPSTQDRIAVRTEYPPEGGVYVFYKGHPFPDKTFVFAEAIYCIDPAKRIMMSCVYFLKNCKLAAFWIGLMMVMPGKNKILYALARELANFWENAMRKIYFDDPNRYCKTGRAIMAAGLQTTETLANGNQEILDVGRRLTWGVVNIWEYDNAYRHRGHDVIRALDKKLAETDPGEALCKLLDLMISREIHSVSEKWRAIRPLVKILTKNKHIKKILSTFFANLDLKQFQFDNGDLYWCYHRKDYNVDGLPLEERLKIRAKISQGRAVIV